MQVGSAARQTEAVLNRAARKNSTQCQPMMQPVPSSFSASPRVTRRLRPVVSATTANPAAASPVRQTVTSSGGRVMSLPRMAVNPQARMTR